MEGITSFCSISHLSMLPVCCPVRPERLDLFFLAVRQRFGHQPPLLHAEVIAIFTNKWHNIKNTAASWQYCLFIRPYRVQTQSSDWPSSGWLVVYQTHLGIFIIWCHDPVLLTKTLNRVRVNFNIANSDLGRVRSSRFSTIPTVIMMNGCAGAEQRQ